MSTVCAEVKTGKPAAYIIDVLVNCVEGTVVGQGPRQQPMLAAPTSSGVPLVVAFPLEQVHHPPLPKPPYVCCVLTSSHQHVFAGLENSGTLHLPHNHVPWHILSQRACQ